MINGQKIESISPKAEIHPSAKIGANVTIGPFTYIDRDVEIGEGTWIGPNVTIFQGAKIGKHCRIFPGAVIAAIPQDLKFKGEATFVEIGDRTTIRECVTINRATQYAWKTVVGSDCLLMAYVHVAHDCQLGDHIILANAVNLAGHVEIEDYAILEGMVAVQQFIKIGAHSFVAGGSLVRKNVPPYIKAAREPISYIGINSIGLERRGFSKEMIHELHNIYLPLFQGKMIQKEALLLIEENFAPSVHRDYILDFVRNSPKGIVRGLHKRKELDT